MEGEGISSLALPSGPAETASNGLAGGGGEVPEVLTEGGGERISQVHPCHLGPQRHLPAFDRAFNRDTSPQWTQWRWRGGTRGLALPSARSSQVVVHLHVFVPSAVQ